MNTPPMCVTKNPAAGSRTLRKDRTVGFLPGLAAVDEPGYDPLARVISGLPPEKVGCLRRQAIPCPAACVLAVQKCSIELGVGRATDPRPGQCEPHRPLSPHILQRKYSGVL
jgi:hypothetical protein